jgi:hypothetical protein
MCSPSLATAQGEGDLRLAACLIRPVKHGQYGYNPRALLLLLLLP